MKLKFTTLESRNRWELTIAIMLSRRAVSTASQASKIISQIPSISRATFSTARRLRASPEIDDPDMVGKQKNW
jgi:hypothetical protein